MKIVTVSLSSEARRVFEYLNRESEHSKTEKSILKAIRQKIEIIKINPHYGDPLSKKLMPVEYVQKYKVTNLFRIELPNFWRMLYTLTEGETKIEIVAFVLDIINHKDYNRIFGYKS